MTEKYETYGAWGVVRRGRAFTVGRCVLINGQTVRVQFLCATTRTRVFRSRETAQAAADKANQS